MTIEQLTNQRISTVQPLPQPKGSCDIPVYSPGSLRRSIFHRCGKCICKIFLEVSPQTPFSYVYNSMKGIDYIAANAKGLLIKEFVIEAFKLRPFPVLPISTFFYLWVWLPHPSGLVVPPSFESWLRDYVMCRYTNLVVWQTLSLSSVLAQAL